MKSTFFFIVMLFFVNASKDMISPEVDTALLEISKDPSSEAVFATMAIQLEAVRGRPGFQRVLGLLTELVNDSKAQLHSMTKIWRGVNARCQVSKVKLAGRQEFFETYLEQARRRVRQATERLANANDNLAGLTRSEEVYADTLKREIDRHGYLSRNLKDRFAHAQEGVNSIKEALNAVENWTPKGQALIQTHLESVAKSYLKVKDYALPSITEFLERTTDAKVRKRLAEWLSQVGGQLMLGANGFRDSLARLQQIGGEVEAALAGVLTTVQAGMVHARKTITYAQNRIQSSKNSAALYEKLVEQNRALIVANNAYCQDESNSYNKNRALAQAAIKLFREIRRYFIDNYSKLHNYIKTKYHRSY